jgi:hypothetical protein
MVWLILYDKTRSAVLLLQNNNRGLRTSAGKSLV